MRVGSDDRREHAEVLRKALRQNQGLKSRRGKYPEDNREETHEGFATEGVFLLVAIHPATDSEAGGESPAS